MRESTINTPGYVRNMMADRLDMSRVNEMRAKYAYISAENEARHLDRAIDCLLSDVLAKESQPQPEEEGCAAMTLIAVAVAIFMAVMLIALGSAIAFGAVRQV